MKRIALILSVLLALLVMLMAVACKPEDATPPDEKENEPVDEAEVPVEKPSIRFTEVPECEGIVFYTPTPDEIEKNVISEKDCWLFRHWRQDQTNYFYLNITDASAKAMNTERVLLTMEVYATDKLTVSLDCVSAGKDTVVEKTLAGEYGWQTIVFELSSLGLTKAQDGYDFKITMKGPELIRVAYAEFAAVEMFPSELAVLEIEEKRANMEQTLMGLFDGSTTEIVEENVTFGGNFNMHFPDFIRVGDEIYAYYIGADVNGKMGTCLAISKDNGQTFTKHGVILNAEEKYDVGYAAFAGIWYDEEEMMFYMVYEACGDGSTGGQDVALATSMDGIDFKKQGVILDEDDCPPSWCRANVGTPDLYKEGDTWYVFFHGYNGDDCQIGVAYGKDLFNLEVYPEPVVPTGKVPGSINSGTTGRRDVVKYGDTYFMVYEVSSDKVGGNYSKSNWTHMFAYSKDLIHWTSVEAPLVDQGDYAGMGYDGPAWLEIDGDMYVYFRIPGNKTMRSKLVPKD